MKKIIIFLVQVIFCLTAVFAEKKLDEAINAASKDIKRNCNKKTILLIYDFDIHAGTSSKKSKRLSEEIRKRLVNSLNNSDITIVTRRPEDMMEIEKELVFQHNSGMVSPDTIISIGNLLGANTAVLGEFDELSGAYRMNVRLMNLKSGRIIYSKLYDGISYSKEIAELLGIASSYKKVGLGIGAEVNKNSVDFIAPAVSVSFDYNIFRNVSLGFKMLASYDLKEKGYDSTIFEPFVFLRVYLASPSGDPGTGVFIEGLGGFSILLVDSDIKMLVSGGGAFGYRAAFGNFYIEPELRVGSPYIFGAGLTAGFRF